MSNYPDVRGQRSGVNKSPTRDSVLGSQNDREQYAVDRYRRVVSGAS